MINQQAELKAKLFDLIQENEKLKKELDDETKRVSELESDVNYLTNVNNHRMEKIQALVMEKVAIKSLLRDRTNEVQELRKRSNMAEVKRQVELEVVNAIEHAFAKQDVALF